VPASSAKPDRPLSSRPVVIDDSLQSASADHGSAMSILAEQVSAARSGTGGLPPGGEFPAEAHSPVLGAYTAIHRSTLLRNVFLKEGEDNGQAVGDLRP
jgi:hypothetical protein